jgi:hypothetical protein
MVLIIMTSDSYSQPTSNPSSRTTYMSEQNCHITVAIMRDKFKSAEKCIRGMTDILILAAQRKSEKRDEKYVRQVYSVVYRYKTETGSNTLIISLNIATKMYSYYLSNDFAQFDLMCIFLDKIIKHFCIKEIKLPHLNHKEHVKNGN